MHLGVEDLHTGRKVDVLGGDVARAGGHERRLDLGRVGVHPAHDALEVQHDVGDILLTPVMVENSWATPSMRLVMEEQGGWKIRTVNLQELMDPIDWVRKLTGLRMQDLYNLMLKKGWTLGTPQTVRVLQFLYGSSMRRQCDSGRVLAIE